jgi:hypothetical protein
MNFEIDDGVPIPKKRTGKAIYYPFDKLKVGQSFFVPPDDYEQNTLLHNLRQACGYHQRITMPGRKFVARAWENGVRVWRAE